jgi:hypothetical protein
MKSYCIRIFIESVHQLLRGVSRRKNDVSNDFARGSTDEAALAGCGCGWELQLRYGTNDLQIPSVELVHCIRERRIGHRQPAQRVDFREEVLDLRVMRTCRDGIGMVSETNLHRTRRQDGLRSKI